MKKIQPESTAANGTKKKAKPIQISAKPNAKTKPMARAAKTTKAIAAPEKPTAIIRLKPASQYPTYRINPFVDKTVIKTKTKRLTVGKGATLIDLQTGEIEGVTEVVQVFRVDEARFIKVYTSQIKAFFDLGQGAYRLMQIVFAITQKTPPHSDRIYMNPETLPEDLPSISTSAFYRSLAELLEKGFLARVESDKHWYFINPSLFFNGDRVRFITEYNKSKYDPRQQELPMGLDEPPMLPIGKDVG